ncbi:MAG: serine/threonine protein kinase, partial [Arenicella sp.]|nr:serine/threonine protein kinase [Arenicella sp.]
MEKQLGPNTQLGRYKLNSLLGIGGSSEVYRATDTELKRQVAIKCIHITTADKSATQSIEHEAALTAQLNHPNIVQLHDIVITDQVLGLVMEYVDGATLKETMKQTKPDQSQALDWLAQISKGLGHAHKSGIIHCDLKLDNVVLTKDNVVKIADFGIAKALLPVKTPGSIKFPEPTSSSQISGSAHAVSPEQAQGKQLDVRTDIFSFGILAYQLLTGRHPFGIDQDDQTIMQRIVHQPFEFSAADRISMPDTLLGLISALLEKKPTNRPKNMEAISARLQHILELTRSDTKEDDHTRLIPLITSVKFWQQPIIQWCAFAMLLTVITLSSWFLWPTNKPEPVYVALI